MLVLTSRRLLHRCPLTCLAIVGGQKKKMGCDLGSQRWRWPGKVAGKIVPEPCVCMRSSMGHLWPVLLVAERVLWFVASLRLPFSVVSYTSIRSLHEQTALRPLSQGRSAATRGGNSTSHVWHLDQDRAGGSLTRAGMLLQHCGCQHCGISHCHSTTSHFCCCSWCSD